MNFQLQGTILLVQAILIIYQSDNMSPINGNIRYGWTLQKQMTISATYLLRSNMCLVYDNSIPF